MRISRILLLFTCAGVDAPAQPARPRARIIEDWRLKAEDHNFSRIPRSYVGPQNVTVVPLRDETRLALFDSTGRRFASVGGKGSGPGEFLDALGVIIRWKADTMWVYESMQRRTSYFTPNAKLLRTVTTSRIDRIQLLDG